MTWNDLDWTALERLRGTFLSGAAAAGPYWQSTTDLAAYDFTYAERIGWKWDHVLRELRLRGWSPSSRTVLDWGCGSGIAARRVIAGWGAGNFDRLTCWDHSPLAAGFATDAAQRAFPSLAVAQATPGYLAGEEPVGLLLLSHVLNELPPAALDGLRRLIARAEAVLWVEPGTHAVSRQLGQLRAELLAGGLRVVAPCTAGGACPMFAEGNSRHWCHFFAPPPSEIFADSHWVKFGQRAGIDLRSLPYAFLALDRRAGTGTADGLSRVIGRPEHFKPYARVLNCSAGGLEQLEIPKKTPGGLYKELERSRSPLVYRWQHAAGKVSSGESLRPAGTTEPPADPAGADLG